MDSDDDAESVVDSDEEAGSVDDSDDEAGSEEDSVEDSGALSCGAELDSEEVSEEVSDRDVI